MTSEKGLPQHGSIPYVVICGVTVVIAAGLWTLCYWHSPRQINRKTRKSDHDEAQQTVLYRKQKTEFMEENNGDLYRKHIPMETDECQSSRNTLPPPKQKTNAPAITQSAPPQPPPPALEEYIYGVRTNKDGAVMTLPLNVEQCSQEQLIYLLEHYILNNDSLQRGLQSYKVIFIAYFTDKQIDGQILQQMSAESFALSVVEYAISDQKLYDVAIKLFAKIQNYGQIIQAILWSTKPKRIEQCTVDQISFILLNYVLTDERFIKLAPYQSEIIRFLNENEFDGSKLINISGTEFGQQLIAYLGDEQCLHKCAKIHNCLTRFELLQVPGHGLKASNETLSAQQSPAPNVISPSISSSISAISQSHSTALKIQDSEQKQSEQTTLRQRRLSNNMKQSGDTATLQPMATRQQRPGTTNELALLGQDAFCEYVVECTKNIPASKTVQNMIDCIVKQGISGKILIQHYDAENYKKLKEFVEGNLNCNEMNFGKYLTSKIRFHHKNNEIAFDNLNSEELAEYIEKESYFFPAFAFRTGNIDGDEYCYQNSKFVLDLLRNECGFQAGTARLLIAKIDKYPHKKASDSNRISETETFVRELGVINADIKSLQSDTSDTSETITDSVSVSVSHQSPKLNSKNKQIKIIKLETLFADHAYKIYKRENERHFRRINERLKQVGIQNIFQYDKEKKINKKYFVKQAKLVYKIDVGLFYEKVYKDIITHSLGFHAAFNWKEVTIWIVNYELNKLHQVIIDNKITKRTFQNQMAKQNDIFCKQYMAFLPKKRRKVLWKKLKKDLSKGKLNHM